MLKYKVAQPVVAGGTINLQIGLKNATHLSGLSDNIDNLVTDQTQLAINPEQDGEKRRFLPAAGSSVSFYFWNGSSYVNNISPLEFIGVSATTTAAYLRSFYILQVFDTPKEDNNVLYHSGFINGVQFNFSLISTYSINDTLEYGDIHIPKYFLDTLTANTFTMYFKWNFYSGKSGKILPFYNGATSLSGEADMYLAVQFDMTTMKYTLSNSSFNEIKNTDYVTRITDSVPSTNLQAPVYPTGSTFQTDGTYVTLT